MTATRVRAPARAVTASTVRRGDLIDADLRNPAPVIVTTTSTDMDLIIYEWVSPPGTMLCEGSGAHNPWDMIPLRSRAEHVPADELAVGDALLLTEHHRMCVLVTRVDFVARRGFWEIGYVAGLLPTGMFHVTGTLQRDAHQLFTRIAPGGAW